MLRTCVTSNSACHRSFCSVYAAGGAGGSGGGGGGLGIVAARTAANSVAHGNSRRRVDMPQCDLSGDRAAGGTPQVRNETCEHTERVEYDRLVAAEYNQDDPHRRSLPLSCGRAGCGGYSRAAKYVSLQLRNVSKVDQSPDLYQSRDSKTGSSESTQTCAWRMFPPPDFLCAGGVWSRCERIEVLVGAWDEHSAKDPIPPHAVQRIFVDGAASAVT